MDVMKNLSDCLDHAKRDLKKSYIFPLKKPTTTYLA